MWKQIETIRLKIEIVDEAHIETQSQGQLLKNL